MTTKLASDFFAILLRLPGSPAHAVQRLLLFDYDTFAGIKRASSVISRECELESLFPFAFTHLCLKPLILDV